jgi:hypothetical protein
LITTEGNVSRPVRASSPERARKWQLIHQILLNPNVAREQINEEQLGKSGLFVDPTDGGLFLQPHSRAL